MHPGDLYAALAGLLWSGSVILMRVSGFTVRPLPLTFFKSFVALLCFVALSRLLGEPLIPGLTLTDALRLALSAVLGISVADTMFAAALNRLGASLQALADCVYAPAMALVGFFLFREVPGPWECAGGVLVISGVAVGMRLTPEVKTKGDLVAGVALAIGAHVIMAVGILMVRDIYRELSVVWVSGFRFLVATAVLGAYALCLPTRPALIVPFKRRAMWPTLIPMAVLGPFLATLFWVAGFKHTTAARAAIFNQLSTAFIIALAVIFLGERLTWRKLAGVLLAGSGAALIATH